MIVHRISAIAQGRAQVQLSWSAYVSLYVRGGKQSMIVHRISVIAQGRAQLQLSWSAYVSLYARKKKT